MCSRYSLMNRHLPKLLMMVIARIILNAGTTRQERLRRTATRRQRARGRQAKPRSFGGGGLEEWLLHIDRYGEISYLILSIGSHR